MVTGNTSVRAALRAGTADWHDRVDAIFSRADLSDPVSYGRFLSAQAAAYLPVEADLEAAGIGNILADWPLRKRADLIRSDLEALSLPVPQPEDGPPLSGVPTLLGAVYVLEGSRLGAAVLNRSVADSLPRSFLSASRPAAWRELISVLDERLASPEDIAAAVRAACDVFAIFERSGRRFLKG